MDGKERSLMSIFVTILIGFIWTFIVFWLGYFFHWLRTGDQRRDLKALRGLLQDARDVVNQPQRRRKKR
jgi:hypothetical protein